MGIITLRFPDDLDKLLRQRAKYSARSLSEYIRDLVIEKLENIAEKRDEKEEATTPSHSEYIERILLKTSLESLVIGRYLLAFKDKSLLNEVNQTVQTLLQQITEKEKSHHGS